MADLTFGLGALGIAALGIVLLIIAIYMAKEIGQPGAKLLKAAGMIAILLGAVTYIGVMDWNADDDGTQSIAKPSYDITVAEYEAEVYVDASSHRVTVAMAFNDTADTFNTNTGVISLNWTLMRSDALITDSVAALSMGAVPTVDVAGAADEYIVDQNADDSFNAKFVKSGAVYNYESINVLVEAGESAFVNVTITLNADAVENMSQYDSVTMYMYIGGEAWAIVFEKAVITT
jgi:hypothetical protein